MSYKKQLPEFIPLFLVGSVLLIFSVFCAVLLCVFTFWIPCSGVHYDFRIKTMFGSSLSQVVCSRALVLFKLFVFGCVYWCPTLIILCFCFGFPCPVYPMLPIFLDCPFFLGPAGFGILLYNCCCSIYIYQLYQ